MKEVFIKSSEFIYIFTLLRPDFYWLQTYLPFAVWSSVARPGTGLGTVVSLIHVIHLRFICQLAVAKNQGMGSRNGSCLKIKTRHSVVQVIAMTTDFWPQVPRTPHQNCAQINKRLRARYFVVNHFYHLDLLCKRDSMKAINYDPWIV